jgi:hypothetical protein
VAAKKRRRGLAGRSLVGDALPCGETPIGCALIYQRIAVRRDADRLCIDRSQCDTCPASSPKDASKIAEALTQAPRKEIVYMESAAIQGQPCEAESPHSYLGIEQATVERIAEWIAAMSRQ